MKYQVVGKNVEVTEAMKNVIALETAYMNNNPVL